MHEFVRFCIVGFTGYFIDAALLELGVKAGLAAPAARLISMALAMQIIYLLHGFFTYRGHGGYSWRNWRRFMLTNGIGASINYGIFLLVLHFAPIADALLHRQCALVCGTAVALFFNHWANRTFVFRTRGQP